MSSTVGSAQSTPRRKRAARRARDHHRARHQDVGHDQQRRPAHARHLRRGVRRGQRDDRAERDRHARVDRAQRHERAAAHGGRRARSRGTGRGSPGRPRGGRPPPGDSCRSSSPGIAASSAALANRKNPAVDQERHLAEEGEPLLQERPALLRREVDRARHAPAEATAPLGHRRSIVERSAPPRSAGHERASGDRSGGAQGGRGRDRWPWPCWSPSRWRRGRPATRCSSPRTARARCPS